MVDKLEMLIALAKEAHFGKAAESLGVTQPTLSAGIKSLEAELGAQLVWRGSRYGGLTPEGQRALDWARRIVGDTRALRDEMRASHKGLSGVLRLAVIPTALTAAAGLSAAFNRAHPGVGFTILSRSSTQLLGMLENLEADAGITYLDNEPLGRVSSVPLYREKYHVVCRAGGTLSGRDSLVWRDLDGLPLCLLTPDMQNRRIINQYLLAAGVTVDTTIQSNSTVVLMSHVVMGDWVTILPQHLAEFLATGRPVDSIPITPEAQTPAPSVGLVAPWRDPHTPVLEALLREATAMASRLA